MAESSYDAINSLNAGRIQATSNKNIADTKSGLSSKNQLKMEDFLNLLVAQLSNQDMYNTVDNTEYMAQMAQFSVLQGVTDLQKSVENLNEIALSSYSVNMIGKEAVIAKENVNGEIEKLVGIIEGVSYYEGETKVMIDGKHYSLSRVMEIHDEPNLIIPGGGVKDESGDAKGSSETEK